MTTPAPVSTDAEERVVLPGFHPPLQRRSRATLEALTEAVGALLLDAGAADFSVREIVTRADTSIGAFYARFDDRSAALAYASHDFWAHSRRLWSDYLAPERWAGAGAASVVVSVIRTFTWTMWRDSRRVQAFVRLSLSVPDPAVARRIGEHDRFIALRMSELLALRGGDLRHPRPGRAAEAGFQTVLAAVRDRVVFGPNPPGAVEGRRVVLALCQMYGRYLDVHPVPDDYEELLALVWRARHDTS